MTPQEAAAIAQCFKDKNFDDFMSAGIKVENRKFTFLREEDGKIVMAKLKGVGGLTLQASKTGKIIMLSFYTHIIGFIKMEQYFLYYRTLHKLYW